MVLVASAPSDQTKSCQSFPLLPSSSRCQSLALQGQLKGTGRRQGMQVGPGP